VIAKAETTIQQMDACFASAFFNYFQAVNKSKVTEFLESVTDHGFAFNDSFKREFNIESALFCYREITQQNTKTYWFDEMIGSFVLGKEKSYNKCRMAGSVLSRLITRSNFKRNHVGFVTSLAQFLVSAVKVTVFAGEGLEKAAEDTGGLASQALDVTQQFSFFRLDPDGKVSVFLMKEPVADVGFDLHERLQEWTGAKLNDHFFDLASDLFVAAWSYALILPGALKFAKLLIVMLQESVVALSVDVQSSETRRKLENYMKIPMRQDITRDATKNLFSVTQNKNVPERAPFATARIAKGQLYRDPFWHRPRHHEKEQFGPLLRLLA
jgi:hypothetical protein